MKKEKFLLLAISASLVFSSCGSPAPSVDTTDTLSPATEESEAPTETAAPEVPAFDGTFATDAYAVTCVGDQFYLNFNESHKATSAEISACQEAGITFESLADFKDKLINGKLTASEQITMQAAFPKDENGILMCDLTQLYEPVLPDGTASYSWVYWKGGAALSFAYGSHMVSLTTKDEYRNFFQTEYVNAPNTTNYTITADYEGIYDGQPCRWIELTRRNGKSFRVGCMDLPVGGRTVYVVLNFQAPQETGTDSSEIAQQTPFGGKIMTEIDGHYLVVFIVSPSTAPTVEWLTSFGVRPYVENSNADHVTS